MAIVAFDIKVEVRVFHFVLRCDYVVSLESFLNLAFLQETLQFLVRLTPYRNIRGRNVVVSYR